jgi:nucleotide-binding universal stress UspA family protein
MTDREPIVVGIDGSPESEHAMRWAAEEAVREKRPLKLVHAWHWPFLQVALDAASGTPAEAGFREEAALLLAAATAHVQGLAPDLEVTSEFVGVGPAPALLDASEDAALVVIGSRGHGGFTGLLVGSVGVALAGHTRCPLVVVREDHPSTGPVLVGVDDSEHAAAVLDLAFAEAASRGTTVEALHAWHRPVVVPDWPDVTLQMLHTEKERAQEVAAAALEAARVRHPGVTAELRVIEGSPSAHLVDSSQHAQLVVVGARGRGGFSGLVLGSTSQALLHHAACPVMIGARYSEDTSAS